MPEISNISNLKAVETKKVTSKLSFEVGEVFQARVVNVVKPGNEFLLKTLDGWQFSATTKSPIEETPEGLIKFKVVGYEEGKLQVIIVPAEMDGNSIEEKSIETILKQQNLGSTKKDIEMFKSMVQHDIPLTKENISFIKTIMDFKEKMYSNDQEQDVFIEKYLQSKGIDSNSEEGKQVSQTLKGFFEELKQASLEDILTLKENGLELTEPNLKSFNKIFKGDMALYNELVSNENTERAPVLNKGVDLNDKKNILELVDIFNNKSLDKSLDNSEEKKSLIVSAEGKSENINNSEENIQSPSKKNNIGNNNNIDLENFQIESFENSSDDVKSNELSKSNEKSNNSISSQSMTNEIEKDSEKNNYVNNNQTNRDEIEKDIPKSINFNNNQSSNNEVENRNEKSNNITNSQLINHDIEKDNQKNSDFNLIKGLKDITSKGGEEFKIVKSIMDNGIQLSKENVSLVKTIIDLKEKILPDNNKQELLINKFIEKKGIELDSEYGKEVAKNIRELLNIVKKEPIKEIVNRFNADPEVYKENSEAKAFSQNIKEDLPEMKELIKDILKSDNLVKSKESIKNSQLSENIKNEIAQKTDMMKDIIKNIKQGDWSLIKNNINDIKVFNSISNQYYFMDVPLNISQNQYECKLLIKDERKKGKKIDSKNVKMLISVKTINMGKVDAFIKVQERNLNIDLKCNDNWVKVLENENHRLYNTLEELNYNVVIKVEKRKDDANIVSTREFFQDNTIGSINTIV